MDKRLLVKGPSNERRSNNYGTVGERNSKLLLKSERVESQHNDSLIRPSKDSKIPNYGIGEIVIKTYDRVKSSIGS
jgi:hypothetical protein